jgi:hypothetical protein
MKPGSKNITTKENFSKKADSLISQFQNKATPDQVKNRPKTQKEKYFEAMRKQNDSLRKLPKNDPHYLPTFEDSPKGMEEMNKFYTFSKDNKKLKKLRVLDKKLRKKYLNF